MSSILNVSAGDILDTDIPVTFERLEFCNLQLPQYATEQAAAVDFRACLTRLQAPDVQNIIRNISAQGIKQFVWRLDTFKTQNDNFLVIGSGDHVIIPTGFKTEFPPGYVLKLHVRSSIGISGLMLANSTAVIDSDYRGEIFISLFNYSQYKVTINHGDRIAQGILSKHERMRITEGTVNTTARGTGGLGSTGK